MALVFAQRIGRVQTGSLKRHFLLPARDFSSATERRDSDGSQEAQPKGSILDLKHASQHCRDSVKKFDYAAFRVAAHFPSSLQPFYFAINAFFLEVLKSREVSRERSIC